MSEVSMNLGQVSIVPKGDYDPKTVYKHLDLVRYGGNGWICLIDGTTGVEPVNGDNWMQLVDKGDSAYKQATDAGLTATEAEFKSALAKVVDIYGDWEAGLTEDEQVDPDVVYEKSRPIDWMKMPALEDTQDGEFWLLFQWLKNDVTECSFTMRANSDIKVEAGRYEDGVFTVQEKYTQDYHPASATTNTAVPISLDGADFGDMTSEGKVQAMVRVSGELTRVELTTLYATFVDSIISARNLVQLTMNNSGIIYFAIVNISTASPVIQFSSSQMLLAVRGTATGFNYLTSGHGTFSSCYALRAIPLDATFERCVTGGNLYSGLFESCYSLKRVPPGLKLSSLVSGTRVFAYCYSLRNLPDFSFPNATKVDSWFSSSGLQRIVDLYIPNCASFSNPFSNCRLLQELTFDPRMDTWETPQDIGLSNTSLSHAAIVALFNSLPTIKEAKTITLTGTPGAAQVTAEDVAIATEKGWKVAGTAVATASAPIGDGPEIFDDVDTNREPYFLDQNGNEFYGPFYRS